MARADAHAWLKRGSSLQLAAEVTATTTRGPWKTREAVEIATLHWVSWFNHHRLMEGLGYIPPAEAEANYYRHLTEQPASES